jgi:hypothetical protein
MTTERDIFAYSEPLEIVNEYRRGDCSAYEAQGALDLMLTLVAGESEVKQCQFAQAELDKEIARRGSRGI